MSSSLGLNGDRTGPNVEIDAAALVRELRDAR